MLLFPPMRRLGLLLLLLWIKLRTQAQAYPIGQGDEPNIGASDLALFACQNFGDAPKGRCIHALLKRTPWRPDESDTTPDTPSDTNSRPRPPHRRPHHDGENDDDRGYTYKYRSSKWTDVTPETWTDPEASSELQTEWHSTFTPTESDGPTTLTDDYSSPNTPTSLPATESKPIPGPIGTTSESEYPHNSGTDRASSVNSDTIFIPPYSTSSISAPYRPSQRTSTKPTSTHRTTQPTTSTQPTAGRTSSTSTSSPSYILPNPSRTSSLYPFTTITIFPEANRVNSIGSNNTAIDPYPYPIWSNPAAPPPESNINEGVPLAVIVGSVFGIIFGGLALFCLLFGINRLRERKQDNECSRRAERLRNGPGSSSTVVLARAQEGSGGSSQTGQGSTGANGHGERGGILVTEGCDSPAGSGRWIRFANQRRPSSVPVLPEINDNTSTPLMQDWNPPPNVQPPRHHFAERSHSPTVPSPLRVNPVTGRDSPSGWI